MTLISCSSIASFHQTWREKFWAQSFTVKWPTGLVFKLVAFTFDDDSFGTIDSVDVITTSGKDSMPTAKSLCYYEHHFDNREHQ